MTAVARRPRPVVVVGSANLDLLARVARIPRPGETLLAHDFTRQLGGKGANQAVAAARMGAAVRFIGRLGDDSIGAEIRAALEVVGIDLTLLRRSVGVASGMAFVTVETSGENAIVVVPGANDHVLPADLADLADATLLEGSVVLAQQEIPGETIDALAEGCRRSGATFILNAAPARDLSDATLRGTDYLIVNHDEAVALTGLEIDSREDLDKALERLVRRGVGVAVITLGSAGCVALGDGIVTECDGYSVDVVDTTGAGDAFLGAFTAGIALGAGLSDCLALGGAAGALTTTVRGAQLEGLRPDTAHALVDDQPRPIRTRSL